MLLSSSFTSISFPSPNFNLSRNRSPKRILKMAEAAKNPVGQQQKIIVPNKHGEKLVGLLHETGSADLVILCHGFRDTKENSIMVNLAVALENEGSVPSVLTLPEMGKVKAPFSMVTIGERLMTCTLWSNTSLGKNVHPVQLLDTVKVRWIVLLKIVATGGDAVLLYASTYHDICTVVNVSGRYDLKKGIEQRLGKDLKEAIKKEGFFDVMNKPGDGNYRVTEESLMDR